MAKNTLLPNCMPLVPLPMTVKIWPLFQRLHAELTGLQTLDLEFLNVVTTLSGKFWLGVRVYLGYLLE